MQPAVDWLWWLATLAFLGGVLLKLNQLTGFPFFQMFGLWALIGAMLLISRWAERAQAARAEEAVLERLRRRLPAGSRILRLRRGSRPDGEADLLVLAPAGVGLLVCERSAQNRRRRTAERALGEALRRALAAGRRAERLLAGLPGGFREVRVQAAVLLLRRRVVAGEAEAARGEADPAGLVSFLNAEGLEEWLEPLLAPEAWAAPERQAFARLWRGERPAGAEAGEAAVGAGDAAGR